MTLWIVGIAAILFLALVLGAGTASMKITRTISGLFSGSEQVTISDSTAVFANTTVPAAQPATLTTRTNNTSGSLTMTNSSHGITTGQRVDLFWTGGHCYGAVVGTVSGTTVPIASVAGGTNLPIATTAITVGIATSTPFNVTGDNVSALAMYTPTEGYFIFNDGSTNINPTYLAAGKTYTWVSTDPGANPLASGVPTKVFMSHSKTSGAESGMMAGAITH